MSSLESNTILSVLSNIDTKVVKKERYSSLKTVVKKKNGEKVTAVAEM